MHTVAKIAKAVEKNGDTWLVVQLPGVRIKEEIDRKIIHNTEMRFDDGRHISNLQRKKAYATIRDIAAYTGYPPEECKEIMKYSFMISTGEPYFSLSDCSIDTAREFITFCLEMAIRDGIQLSETGVERADDVGKYLWACLRYKKCAVCGRDGEIHHEDAIGMGSDRRTVDDSWNKKICLCRKHHTIAHKRGVESFRKMYHVYGVEFTEESEDDKQQQEREEVRVGTVEDLPGAWL